MLARLALVAATLGVLGLVWQTEMAETPAAFAAYRAQRRTYGQEPQNEKNVARATGMSAPERSGIAPLLTFALLAKQYRTFKVQKRFDPAWLRSVSGALVGIRGAVMPIDTPSADGRLKRFWLVNPRVILEGCIFCNPPTLGDLVYVETTEAPYQVDREKLFTDVVILDLTGRFTVGRAKTYEGDEYLFKLVPKSGSI